MPGLGDAPVQPEYVRQMKTVAQAIDVMFNGAVEKEEKKVGFILMVFPFEDGEHQLGRCNYMSNASRPDVIKMLKEQIGYFEAQDKGQPTNTNHPKGRA